MSIVKTTYYTAVKDRDGNYWGRLYQWSADGNKQIPIWTSGWHYRDSNEAYDAASDYAEKHNIEVEMD